MMQVEAVVKMLQPGFNVASIAAKRRNKSNPWVQARDAVPERGGRTAAGWRSVAAREIADALVADKARQPTRKQAYRRLSLLRRGGPTAGGGWRRSARVVAIERGANRGGLTA
jgi:hypothetical protein